MDDLPYNYVPTEWVCIVFVVLFSLLTSKLLSDQISFYYAVNQLTTIIFFSIVVHAVQAIRSRIWWLFPTAVVCGVTETIGWSGRLWSSKSPDSRTPFLMQCVLTILPRLHRDADCEARQDFHDNHGTNIPYCGQLSYLGTDHKAARSAILSPEPRTV